MHTYFVCKEDKYRKVLNLILQCLVGHQQIVLGQKSIETLHACMTFTKCNPRSSLRLGQQIRHNCTEFADNGFQIRSNAFKNQEN